jgi:hypothetical protein
MRWWATGRAFGETIFTCLGIHQPLFLKLLCQPILINPLFNMAHKTHYTYIKIKCNIINRLNWLCTKTHTAPNSINNNKCSIYNSQLPNLKCTPLNLWWWWLKKIRIILDYRFLNSLFIFPKKYCEAYI